MAELVIATIILLARVWSYFVILNVEENSRTERVKFILKLGKMLELDIDL